MRDGLIDMGREPPGPCHFVQYERWFGKAAAQRPFEVVDEAELARRSLDCAVQHPVKPNRLSRALLDLALGEAVDLQSDRSTRARPGLRVDVATNRASDQEPARPGLGVNQRLDVTERRRDFLPLIDEDRLRAQGQRRLDVGSKSRPLPVVGESDRRGGKTLGGRRLSGGRTTLRLRSWTDRHAHP